MDPTKSYVSVPVDGSHSAIHHASATIDAVIHTSVSIPLVLGESLSVVEELRAELNSCVEQWLSKRAEIDRVAVVGPDPATSSSNRPDVLE